jgi:hypothetical protein
MARQSSARNIQNVTRVCSVDGCGEVMRRRGYCVSHYAEWQKLDDAAKTAALGGMPLPRKPWTFEGNEEALAKECEQGD